MYVSKDYKYKVCILYEEWQTQKWKTNQCQSVSGYADVKGKIKYAK